MESPHDYVCSNDPVDLCGGLAAKMQHPGRMPREHWRVRGVVNSIASAGMLYNGSFEVVLSAARFESYRAIAVDELHAWNLYRWNLDLVAALAPLHSDLEIALRNTIDTQLAKHFGRPDWWASNDLILDDDTTRSLSTVVAKRQRHVVAGTIGTGRVIAELMFGTWVNLLSKGGRSSLGRTVDYEAQLWRPALRNGFTGTPTPTRDDVHKRVALCKELRNRCAHHEPVFDGVHIPGSKALAPRIALVDVWRQAIEVLDWISPDLAEYHRQHHDLNAVIRNRPVS